MKKKITIITVTYNCEDSIEETILSVVNQTYNNIEYVIIDGDSKDKTVSIIDKYSRRYNEIKYLSERDKGIYDAMNKGLKFVEGEFVYFLNSGDLLYDNKVIERIFHEAQQVNDDIIYGDRLIRKHDKRYVNRSCELINLHKLILGTMICHQCMFTKKTVFESIGKFNLDYKICADYDWIIRCYKNGIRFKYIGCVVVDFDYSGVSSQKENISLIQKEKELILERNFNRKIARIIKARHALGNFKRFFISYNKK